MYIDRVALVHETLYYFIEIKLSCVQKKRSKFTCLLIVRDFQFVFIFISLLLLYNLNNVAAAERLCDRTFVGVAFNSAYILNHLALNNQK